MRRNVQFFVDHCLLSFLVGPDHKIYLQGLTLTGNQVLMNQRENNINPQSMIICSGIKGKVRSAYLGNHSCDQLKMFNFWRAPQGPIIHKQ